MPRALDRYGQSDDGPTLRVLGRGSRWLVWREGATALEAVCSSWQEMKEYTDERLAIEGGGCVLVSGFPMHVPGDDVTKMPPRE